MIPEPCVATIGFFDGVHMGHRYLIQQVKEIAAAKGLRSALVTFPVHPRKVMNAAYHPELLTTPEEKTNLLAGTGVDYCLMLDFTPDISRLTAKEFMTQILKERFQVKYLVIGYDHRFGHNRSEGFDDYVRYGQAIGIEVIRAQAYTDDIQIDTIQSAPVSSSLIRKLLHQGDVDVAARCLGHRYLIQQVKEIAAAKGLRSALVTFPVHPRKVMNAAYHPELLTTPEEKTNLLAGTGVDYCLMLDFTPDISRLTAKEFMTQILKERFQVKYLVIGYDHRFGHNRSEGFDDYVRYGQAIGIEVIRAQAYTDDIQIDTIQSAPVSSSLIRKLLHQGDVDVAARCLGYEYFLDGTVVGGYQVGRKIGFPTANLSVDDPDKLIPADGVYAVWVTFDGKTYMGMLNIGVRPTIGNGPNRTIEVNILHFHSDIYDKFIRLTFVKRTRPELKYDSIDELIAQLHKDAEETEAILLAAKQEK